MIAVDRLPPEIRESTRAVVWKRELRHGKATKVPYVPTRPSERAAVDNPATWGAFDQALAVVAAGKADGAGIVLGDGLVGVDLDHCRDVSV
jgi:putative DNA primase/helicase